MSMNWVSARLAAALLALALSAAGHAADDFPPPIAADSPAGAAEPAAPAETPAPGFEAGSPQAAEAAKPAPVVPEHDVRIEQKRIGRRVSEVVVTPAGFTYHYTMIHLEGQDSGSVLQPHPELSVPRFFSIDF
jgi:hypothetical protein